jgi:uncharacterized protein (TIGR02266 family)
VRRRGQALDGVICNISELGVYVAFPEPPDLGEVLDIEISVPGIDHPLRTPATVMWRNADQSPNADDLPPGCGLRFDALPSDEQMLLADVVSEYLAHAPASAKPGPRVPYVQWCDFTYGGSTQAAVVCNLSELGVYVTVDPVPASGERVTVAFRLPGESHLFEAEGTVTWQNIDEPAQLDGVPPGCGLRFDELPVAERARLRDVVERYCARIRAEGGELS